MNLGNGSVRQPNLGPLENSVLEILWERGESNVHQVIERLGRPLAYTTVMTTLDRLYKKGLLERRKQERAFFYSPRMTRAAFEQQAAADVVAGYLARPHPAGEVLISSLVDVMGQLDEALLDELEKKVQAKRKELDQRRQS